MFPRRQLTPGALLLVAACARTIPEQEAARIAQQLLQQQQAGAVEVVQVHPVGGMHKVTLRVAPQQTTDVFISPDGTYFTDRLESVSSEVAGLREDKRFADCLKSAGVSVLVASQQPASQAQLRDLGRFAHKLAIACDDDMANCQALGVRELPTLRHRDTLHAGRHTLAWIETLTGCKR